MSCDYCEQSGEVTASTGGLGRTFSRARWSTGRTDVKAWFEERRRQQGPGRPVVQAAVGTPAVPSEMATAAAQIQDRLLELTRFQFEIVPQTGDFADWLEIRAGPHSSSYLPPALCAALESLGFIVSGNQCALAPGEWRQWGRRLEAVAQARALLDYAQQMGVPVEDPQTALVSNPDGTWLYHQEGALLHVFSWRATGTSAAPGPDKVGFVSYTSTKYAFPDSAAQELAEFRRRAAYQHCLVCGTWQLPDGRCPQCAGPPGDTPGVT